MKRPLLLLCVGVVLLLVSVEFAGLFSTFEPETVHKSGSCVVFALGNPSEDDGGLSPVQQSRVELAVKAYRARQCQSMVFSGGAVANKYVEAEAMAGFAHQLGVPEQAIVIEGQSRNTWENIGCSLPYLQNYGSILIASEILHATRAKRYLCRQQPSLCEAVEPMGSVLPWYFVWRNVRAVVHEISAWIRDILLYEGGTKHNSPSCPSLPSHWATVNQHAKITREWGESTFEKFSLSQR